jgi:hypothetical protein
MMHARSGIREDHGASYFNHNNTEATRLREKLAEDSLDMLIQWLKDGGNVGIHGKSIQSHNSFFSSVTEPAQMRQIVPEVEGEHLSDNCTPYRRISMT